MAQLLMILLGALMVFPLNADPGTIMNLTYHTRLNSYSIYIDFSPDVFNTFHSCLCDNNRTHCCMELSLTFNSSKRSKYSYSYYYDYVATQSYFCGQQNLSHVQTTYSSIYECIFSLEYLQYPASVNCSRFKRGDKRQENIQGRSFFIDSQADYCTLHCVTVSWSRYKTLNINSTKPGFHKGSCVVDPLVTSSLAPLTTETKSSVPTISSETWKGRETVPPTQTLSKNRETTQEIRHTVSLDDKEDDSQSSVFIIVVYIVAGVILIFTVTLSVVMWRRRRRKHQTRHATTSLHDVSEQRTVSQNYSEGTEENLGENTHDNSSGASSAQGADANTAITESKQPENNAVGDAYVSTEEIIRNKRATACKDKGLKLSSNNGDISETENVSTTRNSYKDSQSDFTNTAALGTTSTASSVYTRLGDHIRIFENPYKELRSLEKHTTMKPATENSLAAQDSSAKSSQKTSSASSHNHHNEGPSISTRSVSKCFANSAYEYVDVEDILSSTTNPSVNNDKTKMSLNQEKSASESNDPGRDPEPIQNVYARLGEPVREAENPYDG